MHTNVMCSALNFCTGANECIHAIRSFNLIYSGKIPPSYFWATFDPCVPLDVMPCHYSCFITLRLRLLASCFNRLALQISKCVISDFSSLEKKDGKCPSFTYIYKCCWLQTAIINKTFFSISFPVLLKDYIILRLCYPPPLTDPTRSLCSSFGVW